ncbi:hypothetical protein KM043_010100 [Ampulex compressa]|nr:hypothetical protein KM043_010100 [Ampulex compressa]
MKIMGNSSSCRRAISDDVLQVYEDLTYLTKAEVYRIFQLLDELQPGYLKEDMQYRFSTDQVEKVLPQIRHNPFRDSIYRVFSSQRDGRLSFEDVLDICSVFSENCPESVRAAWAFDIFDFDGDNQVSLADLIEAVQRLTGMREDGQTGIDRGHAEHVARMILKELDLTQMGCIARQEFVHLISRMPDFALTFRFKF